MPMFELTDQEFQQLTMILSDAPWRVANPIIFKMAQQARDQMQMPQSAKHPDGKDAPWSMKEAQ